MFAYLCECRPASIQINTHLSLNDVKLKEARHVINDGEDSDGEYVQSSRFNAAPARWVVRSADGQVAVDCHQHRQVHGARLGDDRRRKQVFASVRQHQLQPRQSQRIQLQQSTINITNSLSVHMYKLIHDLLFLPISTIESRVS